MMDLDSMSTDELAAVWSRCTCSTQAYAQRLFPTKPTGYVAATASLGLYAYHRILATRNPESCTAHNLLCRAIYDSLPIYAKWSVTV